MHSAMPKLEIFSASCTAIYACGLRAGDGTTLEICAIDGVNRQTTAAVAGGEHTRSQYRDTAEGKGLTAHQISLYGDFFQWGSSRGLSIFLYLSFLV
jgi:hypothetical protein